ncbi:MAG: DUF58 domain-containing protein [Gammaproteobacteria bacterium]|nr:DUF58 domain-containing protein [Gammaproteobacteria bacterium]
MKLLAKLQQWLLKRVYYKDTATLNSSDIYILPTREGLLYAIIILLLLSAAINFNNSLIFFFTFLMASVGIISMHMTQQNLLNLTLSIAHVKPVFCLQTLHIPLLISQTTQKNSSKKFSISVQFSHQQKSFQDILTDVPCDESASVALNSPGNQRGAHKLPSLTISSRYPLGLFRAWTNIQLNNDAIVYPKPAQNFAHSPSQGISSEGQGLKGQGFDDFSGFKSYQTGESLKHIHWKAYAREQGLLSKTFTGGNNHEYWLDWNDLRGDIETRLSHLCRLIINAEEQGDRYGLILPDTNVSISNGQLHYHQCLKALALYPAQHV